MDFGLFWSAPAKRRGRIEPQRWGRPAAFARNLDAGFHSRRGDGAFPSPQGLVGDRWIATSKAAAGKSPPANPATTSGPTNFGRDWG